MDIHKNARLSWRGRELLVQSVVAEGLTRKAAAAAFRVSQKTAGKWFGAIWPSVPVGSWITVRGHIAVPGGYRNSFGIR